MCGIVGYIGAEEAAPWLLYGLTKLEYRGYDSAGIAVFEGGNIRVAKAKGRLQNLVDLTHGGADFHGNLGIGHTRWATHGAPSDINSHPQTSELGKFAVVHNGIIENYLELREFLSQRGVSFVSETDTEVIAQLLEYYYTGNIFEAIGKTLARVTGSYALGILCRDDPNTLYAARKDNPLIIGVGQGENFIASDIPALLSKTREVIRLSDLEIARLRADSVEVFGLDFEPIKKKTEHITWDVSAAEKGGYPHFMFKEILEQPKAVADTISPRIRDGRIVLDELKFTREELVNLDRICILACGSAYHVGMIAKYIFEEMLRVPTEVTIASEFRYENPIVSDKTLAIIISQSGETLDTLEAMREAKRRGARTLSIVNVVGSAIALEADDVIYTWAGPEIAVATTKAYSTQLAVIDLLAIYFADLLGKLTPEEYAVLIAGLEALPGKIAEALEKKDAVQYIASQCFNAKNIFFIGRNLDYAMSLEGSLKLKEISYIHSEAYAAGELKHGTISLIEDGTLVVALSTYARLFEKMRNNILEVKTRGATVLGLFTKGGGAESSKADFALEIPQAPTMFLPSLAIIPLQLFAYYIAAMKGCDIDKPRNLAKSVTVE